MDKSDGRTWNLIKELESVINNQYETEKYNI
jgi:hypothetical protein